MANLQQLTLSNPVVVATKNKGKVAEFTYAFGKLGYDVVSMFDYAELPDVIEDGATFMANARKKAFEVGTALGLTVLADDSGLEVEKLGGRPGVYSARYAGEGATDGTNMEKLLRELGASSAADGSGARLSAARFVCALALYEPVSGTFVEAFGTIDGEIIDQRRGDGGFGYDPIFYVPELGRTTAELSKEEKQQISHRGTALRALLAQINPLHE